MVYLRFPTFKTAINVSTLSKFNQNGDYTPMQKMMLTRNRIWGNIIGGNIRSGYSLLKQPVVGKKRTTRYEFFNLDVMFPFYKNYERENMRKEKY